MQRISRWLTVFGALIVTSAILGCGDEEVLPDTQDATSSTSASLAAQTSAASNVPTLTPVGPTASLSPTNTPVPSLSTGSPAATRVRTETPLYVSLAMEGPKSGLPGQRVTYRLNYEVGGDIPGTTVRLSIPDGITFESAEIVDGDASVEIYPGAILAALPVGTGRIDYKFRIPNDAESGTFFSIGTHEPGQLGTFSNWVVTVIREN